MIEDFTPWSALTGGVLIGLGSLGVLVLFGRAAGISGLLGQVVRGNPEGMDWRLSFIVGLLVVPLIYGFFITTPLAFEVNTSTWILVIGGLLVGFGTRLGNGCTSGHGICGISRFSLASLIAVITFMAVAVVLNLII